MDIAEFKDSWPPKKRGEGERESKRERKESRTSMLLLVFSCEYTRVYMYKPC